MNKEERRRALMIQLGKESPEEESHKPIERKQGQAGKKTNQKKSSSAVSASKPKTSGAKKQSGKNKKTVAKHASKAPAAKNISKNVSLSSHKKRQQKKHFNWDMTRLGIYAIAVFVIILLLVTIVKSCKGPGEMVDIDAPKTTESQISSGLQESSDESESTTVGETPEGTDSEQPSVTEASVNVNATVGNQSQVVDASTIVIPNWIKQDFIRVNPYSRPQIPMQKVEHIAIHWVGNPGSTAQGNRNYFDNLGNPEDPVYAYRKASAQFVVGLDGEIIQCMPLNEMAYAVRDVYNPKTISIEVCHKDDIGKFSEVTYNSVVKLAAWLMQQFRLEGEGAILRHHDCDGKDCPKYYVDNPSEWEKLQQDILNYKEWNPYIS